MFESWIHVHPWMTFIFGMMSLLTLNTMFVALGGGYKKFPHPEQPKEVEDKNEEIRKVLFD